MKPTGIVRRIDDLGRVVMPKELRRTLRIRDGDPLEIYMDGNSVMLKKYAPSTGEIGDYAQDYAKTMAEVTGHIALVANNDVFVAVAGAPQREYMDKPVPDNWLAESGKAAAGVFEDTTDSGQSRQVIFANIVISGKKEGIVALCTKDPAAKVSDLERKITETAASFISKQMA